MYECTGYLGRDRHLIKKRMGQLNLEKELVMEEDDGTKKYISQNN